ncbi:MAG: glutathione S-transferase family protein [Proteobacteria bacterium]|nr:MAG: glutathione S-transferase family protein [Pseudomonadota bacterium]
MLSQITITAFPWVPDFAQGNVRDVRVRWALEEVGLPYEVRLINQKDQASSEYRKLQPFGQVPIYQEGDLTLFETGSILLHIAAKSSVLTPEVENAKARMQTWVIAALNSVEPFLMNLAEIDFFSGDQQWAKDHRGDAVKALDDRLTKLSGWLTDKEYLEDRFTVADLMMSSILNIARHTEIVKKYPTLSAYQKRCFDRPAYKKALADQMATFKKHSPKDMMGN